MPALLGLRTLTPYFTSTCEMHLHGWADVTSKEADTMSAVALFRVLACQQVWHCTCMGLDGLQESC